MSTAPLSRMRRNETRWRIPEQLYQAEDADPGKRRVVVVPRGTMSAGLGALSHDDVGPPASARAASSDVGGGVICLITWAGVSAVMFEGGVLALSGRRP